VENRSAAPGGGVGVGILVPFLSLSLSLLPFRPRKRLTCHGDAKQRAKLDQLPGALPAGSVVARQHVAVDTLEMLRRVE